MSALLLNLGIVFLLANVVVIALGHGGPVNWLAVGMLTIGCALNASAVYADRSHAKRHGDA